LIFWYVFQQNFNLGAVLLHCNTSPRQLCAWQLEDVGRFAGASMRKTTRCSTDPLDVVPQADGHSGKTPALMAEMIEYCEQDVRAMRAISKALRPLSAEELADYHVNERINDRGVLVDVPLCHAAVKFASDELTEIQEIVAEVTGGAITSVRSPKMRQWVIDRVGHRLRS
jgi:hypothetical protein